MTTAELKKTANEVRKGIIKSTHAAKSGHPVDLYQQLMYLHIYILLS